MPRVYGYVPGGGKGTGKSGASKCGATGTPLSVVRSFGGAAMVRPPGWLAAGSGQQAVPRIQANIDTGTTNGWAMIGRWLPAPFRRPLPAARCRLRLHKFDQYAVCSRRMEECHG